MKNIVLQDNIPYMRHVQLKPIHCAPLTLQKDQLHCLTQKTQWQTLV
jgi:hypothetical protein